MGRQLVVGFRLVPNTNFANAPSNHPIIMSFFLRRFIPVILCCCFWSFASAVADKKAVITALTDAQCEKFGRELADCVNRGEKVKTIEPLDCDALGKRVVKGLDFSEKDQVDFIQSFSESFKQSFTSQLKAWESAHFIRVSTVKGEKRVLIRIISSEGAVNFIDWVCAPDEQGGIKTIDFFSYLTSELASETTRRGVLPYVAEKNRGLIERLTKGEGAYVRAFSNVTEAMKFFQSGDSDKALGILEALPDEVKTTPFILIIRLQVAQKADKKVYARVIEEWEKARPGDPSLDLVSIDGCIGRKDYDGCIRHLDALQKRLGGDGYLQAMKANVYVIAGNTDKARSTIKEAVAQEPTLPNSYDIWFNLELKAKNWSSLVEALTKFETNFPKVDLWKGIQAEASWAPFRESAECKAWLEKRPEKKSTVDP